jgi:hypothetical protein
VISRGLVMAVPTTTAWAPSRKASRTSSGARNRPSAITGTRSRDESHNEVEIRPGAGRGRRLLRVARQGGGDRVGAEKGGAKALFERGDVGHHRPARPGADERDELGDRLAVARPARGVEGDRIGAGLGHGERAREVRGDGDGETVVEAFQDAEEGQARRRPDRPDVVRPVRPDAAGAALLRRPRHRRHVDGPVQGIVGPRLAGHHQRPARDRERHFTAPEVRPAMNCRESTT